MLLAVMLPGVGVGAQAGGAAVVAGLLGAVAPIRARWRPVSGPVGLWVSRMLAPGDRAWYVRRDGPELIAPLVPPLTLSGAAGLGPPV